MSLSLRVMTADDLPLGMRLKEEAGWNQTRQDWERFLRLSPQGCFVASIDGVDLGTVATFTFGDVAWIAMVLVDARSRGQGVGTALMSHALAHLDSQGVKSIRLDATPLGRPVYLKLGFEDQFELNRYAGTLPEMWMADPPPEVKDITPADREEIIIFDTQMMDTDRSALLKELMTEPDGLACVHRRHGRVMGYLLGRPGAHATFIGPCVATSPQVGRELMSLALMACSGQEIILDIPVEHHHANAWARQLGLPIQRPLTRMCRGRRVHENLSTFWASSGPEKG